MANKQVTLEDLARAEATAAAERTAKRQAYHDGQRQLAADTPALFFTLAQRLREGVQRFNGAAKLERALLYSESTGVTMRDAGPNAELVVEVRRDPSFVTVALRSMWRMGKEDARVIEADGQLGVAPAVDRFSLRVQGIVKGSQLGWRVTTSGRPVDAPIEELPARIVATVATGELSRLWVRAPFVNL